MMKNTQCLSARLESIMLIDDDHITNFLHERLIRKLNLSKEIIIKNNGKEALLHLEDISKQCIPLPSLIFLDINMPVLNGIDFIKMLRKKSFSKFIKIVFLSTSNADQDIQKIKQLGNYECINKPLTAEKIFQLM